MGNQNRLPPFVALYKALLKDPSSPIINIDHHAGNDYFGTVNIKDFG